MTWYIRIGAGVEPGAPRGTGALLVVGELGCSPPRARPASAARWGADARSRRRPRSRAARQRARRRAQSILPARARRGAGASGHRCASWSGGRAAGGAREARGCSPDGPWEARHARRVARSSEDAASGIIGAWPSARRATPGPARRRSSRGSRAPRRRGKWLPRWSRTWPPSSASPSSPTRRSWKG